MYHPPWVTYESHYGCYSPDPSWMNSSEAVSQGSGSCSYPSTYHGDPVANPHGRDSATGRTLASSPTPQLSGVQQSYSVYLKVLSPANKKDFSMFTLRNVNPNELSTLDELKEEIFVQCGEGSQLPRTLEFKIGYFRRSQKLWINNKHRTSMMLGILYAVGRDLPCGLWELLVKVARNVLGHHLTLMMMMTWLTGR